MDEVPKPQLLGNPSSVVIVCPSERFIKSGFNTKASCKIAINVDLTDSLSKFLSFEISENEMVSSNQMLPSES